MRGITVEEKRADDGTGGYRSEAGEGDTLTLRYRWSAHRSATALLLGITLFWDATLLVAVSSGRFSPFMAFLALAAAALSYMSLATLLNRLVITASRKEIRTWSAPLPFPGTRPVVVDARDLVAVDVERVVRQRLNVTSTTYALRAVPRSGEPVRLSDVFTDPEEPTFLAEQLVRWLACRP